MNTKSILRPNELPFYVPSELAHAINELLAAWERNEKLSLDCYRDEVQAAARSVSESNDAWICNYYLMDGWKKDYHE